MQNDEIERLKSLLINDINNGNVTDTLKKIFKKQKEIISVISVLELIYENIYLFNILLKRSSIISNVQSMDEEMLNYIESFRDIVDKLKYYENIDQRIRDNLIVELDDKKEYYESVLDVLFGYFIEARYCNDVLTEKLKSFNTKVDDVSIDEFYKNIRDFIFEDENEKHERIQEVISSIPFALSKKRFFEYMKNGLNHEYNGYDKLMQNIYDIEENFYGKLIDGYGEKFPDIANKIEELQSVDLKNITKEQLEVLLKQCITLISKIQDLREVVYSIIRIINRLLILYKSEVSINLTYSKEPKIKMYIEIYYEIQNGLYNRKQIKESLRRLNHVISEWYFELYSYNKLLNDVNYLENGIDGLLDSDILDDIETLAEYENLMNDDSDVFDDTSSDTIDGNVVMDEIQNLILFIDDMSKNMNPDYRKVRMRRLLGIIPVPRNFESEFFNYLRSSLEFDKTVNVKAAVIESVRNRIKLYKDMKNSKHLYEMLIKNVKEGL